MADTRYRIRNTLIAFSKPKPPVVHRFGTPYSSPFNRRRSLGGESMYDRKSSGNSENSLKLSARIEPTTSRPNIQVLTLTLVVGNRANYYIIEATKRSTYPTPMPIWSIPPHYVQSTPRKRTLYHLGHALYIIFQILLNAVGLRRHNTTPGAKRFSEAKCSNFTYFFRRCFLRAPFTSGVEGIAASPSLRLQILLNIELLNVEYGIVY